jgi:phosphoribosylaminoimidazole-succinocarboxamide synthase
MTTLLRSEVPGCPVRRGKVRDVYDLGDRLVIVATDRISAFDWVLPTGIPDKGRVLTALTLFWLDRLRVPNHLLSTDLYDMGPAFAGRGAELAGRTCLVRKAEVVPVECVVRGYLAGSGWKEYAAGGSVCGIALPPGLRQADRLAGPVFTPATKEESGHDQNIPFEEMARRVGPGLAADLRQRSLEVYEKAEAYARARGILLADTKFEWGRLPGGEVILVDEVLTPDSSGSGRRTATGRGATRRRSTSSTCATGWRRPAGARTARRRRCRRRWSSARGRNTWRPTSG